MSPGIQPMRLAAGGLVDRDVVWRFDFDGRTLEGHPGDTLASALLANGVRLVGRSFKYHRPRGLLGAGSEEPNALMEVGKGARRTPNLKATEVELFRGLIARSQNRWPSLGFDLGAVNGLLSPVFAAGFYYKTFMWPASFWEKVYEPLIRRAAGLGRAADGPDPDGYEKGFAFCDLLVVGAGPAGLMAALVAGRAGARVILAEADFRLGGRLLAERTEIDGRPGAEWAAEVERELESLPNVRLLRRTTVLSTQDQGEYAALERVADHLPEPPPFTPRQTLWKVVARACLLAAGATERPIVFPGNDRPGIMLASAVRTYVNRFGVAPGRRAAVFTSTADGWRTVRDLQAAGVEVAAVIDPGDALPAELPKGVRVFRGARVVSTEGRLGLKSIEIETEDRRFERLAVDTLAVANGWNPAYGLATHLGHKPRWAEDLACFVPGALPPGMAVAGAAKGSFTTAAALAEGRAEAQRALAELGLERGAPAPLPRAEDESTGGKPLWLVADGYGKAFLDLQHDVTADDVALAHREGYRHGEHLKRYTTLGMATDQGRTSTVIGQAIMAGLTGQAIPEIGLPAARPPIVPVAIAAYAGPHKGKHFRPTRLTPTHDWAAARGAVFLETGLWLRAQWFPQAEEEDWLVPVSREAKAVREAVGVCDVSTLGKIDVQGADAAAFLDRVYTNMMSSLPVGRCRYGLMLREDGFVMDDGTAARLGPEHFVISTTTANAAKVMQHLELCRQVLWPELDVQLASVSEQWAQLAVAGPRSRAVLERLLPGVDVSNEALPYMGVTTLELAGGVPARLFRLSFSGELAYELAVPAGYGASLVEAVMAAGEPFGIVPYGTEALGVLRIEKGHAAGGELNGQTTAHDLGLGRMLSTKKDFIGRRMAARAALTDPKRPTLVGLKPVDPKARLRAGAHLLPKGPVPSAEHDQGFVTSVAFSPSLGHWIGLGLLANGPQRLGEVVRAFDPVRDGLVLAEVTSPVFVDPEGVRLRG